MINHQCHEIYPNCMQKLSTSNLTVKNVSCNEKDIKIQDFSDGKIYRM